MRLLVPTAAIAAVVLAATPAAAGTKQVAVGDNFFKPASVTVSKGTTVVWKWTGAVSHNVVVQSGPQKFRSAIGSGPSFSFKHKMTKPGTYKIICEIHGAAAMHMTLTVR